MLCNNFRIFTSIVFHLFISGMIILSPDYYRLNTYELENNLLFSNQLKAL